MCKESDSSFREVLGRSLGQRIGPRDRREASRNDNTRDPGGTGVY